jgi:hypothetical protein
MMIIGLFKYSKKLFFLCYYFTEGNHDYNNDGIIILANAITLNELHEEKKMIINAINKGISMTSDLNFTNFFFSIFFF